jgi:exopolyphosphatase/guanosine-5'-triphosphate,3'-diphosphate pyrophosphatase
MKMKKIGIIDLGTNTFNLLIAEANLTGYKIVHKNKIAVKLGEGGITKDFITPPAFQRGLKTLHGYIETLKEYQVDEYYAVATSAVRCAENGAKFVKEAKLNLGMHIHVIDGNKEADLIYKGVKQTISLGEKPKLIIDIGGGSTEFIIANEEQSFWKQSYQLGAARLLDTFKPGDPIGFNDVSALESHFEYCLEDMFDMAEAYEVDCLVGSSGSFDTLAEMISCKNGAPNSWEKNKYYKFDMHDYNQIQRLIYESTLSERLKMEGLIPMRVDMIVVCIVMINYILNRLTIHDLRVSSYALKEGLINEIIINSNQWQKSLL